MLRRLFLLALLATPSWAVPGCANLSVREIGPTWITLQWQGTGETSWYGRIRWGISAVTENTQGHWGDLGGLLAGNYFTMSATGLTPGTTYMLEAALSADNVSWCTGLSTTQTTAAMPANTDPTPPNMGGMNPHTEPTQTGVTRTTTSCNTTQADLDIAAPGDIIQFANSLECKGSNSAHNPGPDFVWHFNLDGRVGNWITGWACSSVTDQCTKTAHGLSNQQEIRFGAQYNYDNAPRPIDFARTYFARLIDANTIEISLTAGGAKIDLTTNGTGVFITGQIACTNPVLVTSTGTSFPPPGVRTIPNAFPLAKIYLNSPNAARTFDLSWGAASCVIFRNIEFVFDHETTQPATPDPRILPPGFMSRPYNWNITFDRVLVRAATPTQRINKFAELDGSRISVVNSYFDGMRIWSPRWRATPAFTASTISYSGGDKIAYTGGTRCLNVNPSAQITAGTASGTAFVSINPTDCTVQVDGPAGLTVTCTGCTYVASGIADWPLSGGRYSRLNMSRAAITSGQFTSHTDAFAYNSYSAMGVGLGEASAGTVTMVRGPGPYWIENNRFKDGIGIQIYSTGDHYDSTEGDACAPADCPLTYSTPQNFIVRRNHFSYAPELVYSRPEYTGLGDWGGRNVLEWKSGKYVLIEGNTFDGNPIINQNVSAPAITLTPLSVTSQSYITNTTVQDVLIKNNFSKRTGMFTVLTGRKPNEMAYGGFITRRIKLQNNIAATDATENMNGGTLYGSGEFLRNNGAQLVSVENNTVASLKGTLAMVFNISDYRQGGVKAINNLFHLNNDGSLLGAKWSDPTPANPVYNGRTAKQAFDVVWPGYTMYNNAMICGWSESKTETELTQLACDALHDDANDWRDITSTAWASGATTAARRTATKFLNFSADNFRLRYDSPFRGAPYASGAAGADQDAIDIAQGKVTGVSARLTAATTLDLAWTAPSSTFQCSAEVLTNTGTLVSRLQAAQTSRRQSVQFTGLTAATAYQWRVLCEAEQPAGRFMTR